LTPLEVFNDDTLFKRVISRRVSLGDNISDSGIRKMLKIFTNTQAVSNFRPTAAAVLLSKYSCSSGVFFDPCAGWGGRMLGSFLSGMRYVGCEVGKETLVGLDELGSFLGLDYTLFAQGCETELPLEDSSVDIVMTSPPYFDCEKYSEDEDQSYLKYPQRDLWVNLFLEGMLKNCYRLLKKGSYMLLNVANVRTFPDLVDVTRSSAESVGFRFSHCDRLSLSALNSGSFKYEPILCFIRD